MKKNKHTESEALSPLSCSASDSVLLDCGPNELLVTENVILDLSRVLVVQRFPKAGANCYQVVTDSKMVVCLTEEEFQEVRGAIIQKARMKRR